MLTCLLILIVVNQKNKEMKKTLFLILLTAITISNSFAQGYLENQKVIASDLGTGYQFGNSAAIQGDVAVIGSGNANFEGNGPLGVVYIFKRDTNNVWVEHQLLVATDRAQFDKFGQSVAINGDYIIVGASGQRYDANGSNFIAQAGAVYIYKNNGNDNWELEQKITASDREFGAWFGYNVAIQNNRIIVGCGRNSYDVNGQNFQHRAGAGYIFERDDQNIWNQVAKVVAPDRATEDRLGYAVSISGDYVSVGAYLEDEDENGTNTISAAGSIYVYKRDTNGVWNFQQKLVSAVRPNNNEYLGWSLDMDDDFIVAGAIAADEPNSSTGAVYVFKRDANDIWNQVDKLIAGDGVQGENFGYDVAIQNDRILVGAYQDYLVTNGVQNIHGSIYYYTKNSGFDTWSFQQKVVVSNWQNPDINNFGISVDLDGDDALVGNWKSDEVNPDTNETFNEAGSAFLFSFDANLSLGLERNTITSHIKAYPNPTINILNLDFETHLDDIEVTIHNVYGQQVFSRVFANRNSIHLDFQELAKGLYVVEIITNNQTVSVLKVVKK